MTDAFSRNADFSGMEHERELYITDAVHKAFIEVDEAGTEAAAATSIAISDTSALPIKETPVFRADHPFFFLIRDKRYFQATPKCRILCNLTVHVANRYHRDSIFHEVQAIVYL